MTDPILLSPVDLARFPPRCLRVYATIWSAHEDRPTEQTVDELAAFIGLPKRTTQRALRDLESVGLLTVEVISERCGHAQGVPRRRTLQGVTDGALRIFDRLRKGEVKRCRFCKCIAVEKKSGRPMGAICRTCAGKYGGILWWPEFRREAKRLVKDRTPAHLTWSELLSLCHKHEAPRLSTKISDSGDLERQRGHMGALALCVREGLLPRSMLHRDDPEASERDWGFLMEWDKDDEEEAA